MNRTNNHRAWIVWLSRRMVRSRHRRLLNVTSAAAVAGIALGVAALVIATALMTGFQHDLKAKLLGGIPHLTAYRVTVESDESLEPVLQTIRRDPQVRAAFPVVYGQLLIAGPGGNTGVLVKGIPPDARSAIDVLNRIVDGTWQAFDTKGGLAIGVGLAESLGVKAGDRVAVIIPDGLISPLGIMPRRKVTRIAVIFQSDLYEFDHNWAFVDIATLQKWQRMDHEISAIEILIHQVDEAPRVAARLEKALYGHGFMFETWMDQNQALFSALQLEKWMLFVAITLIVVVASFNIVTHLALMVREKRNRIALLLAMGARPADVMRLFLIQGLLLGFTGLAIGMTLGLSISWALDTFHVIRLPVEVYFIPYLPFQPRWFDIAIIAMTAMLISLFAATVPARHASRLRPAVILRAP